ncbi:peptide chain release factor N(5)-glutamine methyltransferase [Alkalimarinus sediminis]|uniref:Release factor glutamine methyltransferase n=1 Tax=Alkalimarinus sediminis TaxID=1632866 RepID=A0A9E8HJY1_9ALTE|nr:peptide chain release factor N(5)-glutamine methyltransferase [Alkalimarinus sediminis]UZW74131.1 peptide chain release factor N(5)-glutamine methyltransferase [Alkalimarinus sediminis]
MTVSIAELLRQAVLPESDTPELDKEVLLCYVLNKDRAYLYTWPEKTLDDAQLASFSSLLERRNSGEPIAYITGIREFWSLPLNVHPSTLIPRPDTERLVEVALELLPNKPLTVVDLGTGTGAIALALASEREQWSITGIDQSEEAVSLAKKNADLNQLQRVAFKVGSWCDSLAPESVDLIVSNPPYIAESDPHLTQGDVRFEPLTALVAAENGLSDIVDIAKQSSVCLKFHGWLMVEHGFEQASAVRQIFKGCGYGQVASYQDLSGNDRVTVGRWQGLEKRQQ